MKVINKDFRNCIIPKGLVITDPPYNQGYHYNNYKDKLSDDEYISLLSKIPKPCVIIHYPEETINILPKALKVRCEQVFCWVGVCPSFGGVGYGTALTRHVRLNFGIIE